MDFLIQPLYYGISSAVASSRAFLHRPWVGSNCDCDGSWGNDLDFEVAPAESRTFGLIGTSFHRFVPGGHFAGKDIGTMIGHNGEMCSIEAYLG